MFKKHILGLAALSLGFGLVFTQSAFKAEKPTRAQYTFHYTGPGTMSESQVENVANWSRDESTQCPDGDDYACSIRVDETYVDNPLTSPTLKSSTNIDASQIGSAKARVSSIAAGTILNTQD